MTPLMFTHRVTHTHTHTPVLQVPQGVAIWSGDGTVNSIRTVDPVKGCG